MMGMKWDDKHPFDLDPLRFIGGAAERYAQMRQDKLKWLRWRLNQSLTQRYGFIDMDRWARKVTFSDYGINDF